MSSEISEVEAELELGIDPTPRYITHYPAAMELGTPGAVECRECGTEWVHGAAFLAEGMGVLEQEAAAQRTLQEAELLGESAAERDTALRFALSRFSRSAETISATEGLSVTTVCPMCNLQQACEHGERWAERRARSF